MKVVCPYCGRSFEVKCSTGRRGRPPINIDINRVKRLLKQYNNNKSVVAKILGISRPTLYKILREYNLE
ncbi:hypothetical protein DRN87_01395 [Candidatus Geothermarchaeota archaeon]|nr:MAG: hypothetical protein DRN87_01395 [Candidatus Geothermarchaeota archaeon]HEW94005.1 hypothetical protein [Thermoprotei archaeon]